MSSVTSRAQPSTALKVINLDRMRIHSIENIFDDGGFRKFFRVLQQCSGICYSDPWGKGPKWGLYEIIHLQTFRS